MSHVRDEIVAVVVALLHAQLEVQLALGRLRKRFGLELRWVKVVARACGWVGCGGNGGARM